MWGGAWTGLWRAERQQEDLSAGLVFGNSSGRRHDKVLVGGGGVNSGKLALLGADGERNPGLWE